MIDLTASQMLRATTGPGGAVHEVETLLRVVPKVELHAHLSGCTRLSTLAELARDPSLKIPESIRRDVRAAVVLKGPAPSYTESFQPWPRLIDRITARPELHHRLAYEVAEDLAKDGIVYAELRTSVRPPYDPVTLTAMLDAVSAAAESAIKDHGIDLRLILGFNRQYFFGVPPQEQVKIASGVVEAARAAGDRVVAFDLWGAEVGRPPRAFAPAYRVIREAGYPLTIHAGEAGSPDHVRQAIDELQCRRIGHGNLMIQRPPLMNRIRNAGIGVEVCLTSNRITGVVPNLALHPLAQMVKQGLSVSLCADNTLVYDTSLSREYAIAMCAGLLGVADVLDLAEGAANLAFLPESGRQELAKKVKLTERLRERIIRSVSQLVDPAGGSA